MAPPLLRAVAIAVTLHLVPAAALAGLPIREIPSKQVQDMMASYDAAGPVIYYNPQYVAHAPAEHVIFVRTHEYAHHVLNHLPRRQRAGNIYKWVKLSRDFELEADCLAAQLVSHDAADSVADFLEGTQGFSSQDILHPSGVDRAAKIRDCSAAPMTKEWKDTLALNRQVFELIEAIRTDPDAAKGSPQTEESWDPQDFSDPYDAAIVFLDGNCKFVAEGTDKTTFKQSCDWQFHSRAEAEKKYAVIRRVVKSHFSVREKKSPKDGVLGQLESDDTDGEGFLGEAEFVSMGPRAEEWGMKPYVVAMYVYWYPPLRRRGR
jgi:hypothetical protein